MLPVTRAWTRIGALLPPASVTVAVRGPGAGRTFAVIVTSATWFGAMVLVPRWIATPGELPGREPDRVVVRRVLRSPVRDAEPERQLAAPRPRKLREVQLAVLRRLARERERELVSDGLHEHGDREPDDDDCDDGQNARAGHRSFTPGRSRGVRDRGWRELPGHG